MISERILAIYGRGGSDAYYGEAVTQTEHALQAAHFAAHAGADAALVAAALLHDIGHLIEAVPDDIAGWKTDARHELVGSRWLARYFGPEVAEPVRLHVPAKRYLCATDPAYVRRLSDASVLTLRLQGGPMSPDEAAAFAAAPYGKHAVRLRQWDDQGKVQGLKTADFDHYRALLDGLCRVRM